MKLRYRADRRTLFWSFGLMPGLVAAHYLQPGLTLYLWPLSFYAAYSAAVIAHNHNHCPTFVARGLNRVFAVWLSVFYGFPTYGWIPTHNDNHHRHNGGKGDATVDASAVARDSFYLAATHFFRSTKTQAPLLTAYREKLLRRSRAAWLWICAEYAAVVGAHATLAAAAVWLRGPIYGALLYAAALGGPALFALWAIMLTNWVQHVGCNPSSRYDHSRNFVAPWLNALLFDNGYHTVHHQRPGLHWSQLRREHAKIAHLIDPRLNMSSFFEYGWRTYVPHATPEAAARRRTEERLNDPQTSI